MSDLLDRVGKVVWTVIDGVRDELLDLCTRRDHCFESQLMLAAGKVEVERAFRWGGFLTDVVRVPFADHMLVPVPGDIDPAVIASLSDNVPDAYAPVAPGLERFPGASVLVVAGSGSIGLYAVGIALALGAERVDFASLTGFGLERAEQLGASIIDLSEAQGRGPYAVTIDASSRAAGLLAALRSTDVGGICSSTGFYFEDVTVEPLDMLNLYFTDVTFTIGMVHARGAIPPLLDLVCGGRLHPELVTEQVLSWHDAPTAMETVRDKLVFVRDLASDSPDRGVES